MQPRVHDNDSDEITVIRGVHYHQDFYEKPRELTFYWSVANASSVG